MLMDAVEMDYKSYSVLYVDDEPANLTAFSYCFEEEFRVLTAPSGEEALRVMATNPVAVLLSDQRMPGMTGATLCTRVREVHPDTVRIVVSAFTDIGAMIEAINSGQVARYILKPWREEEVAGVLRSSLEAFHLGRLVKALQVRLLQSQQEAGAHMVFRRLLHEIANPLNAIGGTLDFAVHSLPAIVGGLRGTPGEALTLAEEVHAATKDALEAYGVVRGVIAHFRAGQQYAPPRPVGMDLCRAVVSAVAIVRGEIRKRAQVLVSTPPDLPPVAMDATQASQVLVNLLINAYEALDPAKTDTNRVEVTVTREGREAVVNVTDTGCGIAGENLSQVFVPYFSTKSAEHSRGLGLAVVKDLVEHAKGSIQVRSTPGAGTTFTVRLPLA